MPLAATLQALLCHSGVIVFVQSSWADILTKECLYGTVVCIWLAARAMSGWWGAGIAAAYAASSPLLFVLDKQLSPAALGLFAASLSCWLAIEAFARPNRKGNLLFRWLWVVSALLALSLHPSTVWLVLAQALYGLACTRPIALARPMLATGVLCSIVTLIAAFEPSPRTATAILRADVRALPIDIFALSFPDEWLSQPHMATYLSLAFLLILICGAAAARSTVLPYFVAGVFAQTVLALLLSADPLVKVTSLAYTIVVMALALAALTSFLIQRKPHMLAFGLPALVVAAQYAAFGRLSLVPDETFDFDRVAPPPIPAFAVGEHAALYHDLHHADSMTVHASLDGYLHRRDTIVVPADTPVTVRTVVPYRVQRQVLYAYEIRADDFALKGFVSDSAMWSRPDIYQCVRQRYSKVRLYQIPNPAFRENGHSILEPPNTIFRVIGVQANPYEPELRVEIMNGATPSQSGWIYAQILLMGDAASTDRAMHFPCS